MYIKLFYIYIERVKKDLPFFKILSELLSPQTHETLKVKDQRLLCIVSGYIIDGQSPRGLLKCQQDSYSISRTLSKLQVKCVDTVTRVLITVYVCGFFFIVYTARWQSTFQHSEKTPSSATVMFFCLVGQQCHLNIKNGNAT